MILHSYTDELLGRERENIYIYTRVYLYIIYISSEISLKEGFDSDRENIGWIKLQKLT